MKSNYTFNDLFDADINSAPFGKVQRSKVKVSELVCLERLFPQANFQRYAFNR